MVDGAPLKDLLCAKARQASPLVILARSQGVEIGHDVRAEHDDLPSITNRSWRSFSAATTTNEEATRPIMAARLIRHTALIADEHHPAAVVLDFVYPGWTLLRMR
jgi:hypothetical protein